MMSADIMQMMIDYQKSIRQANDEEDSDDDEEEKRRLAELELRNKKFCNRISRICKRSDDEDDFFAFKAFKKNKSKPADSVPKDVLNPTLNSIRNFFVKELKLNYFEVKSYFIRRQQIYFQGGSNSGSEIKRINISQIKNTDGISGASKINNLLEVAMLQDITLHLNTFNDFLMANTTLIISHSKILSIYDFLTKQWTHMLPSE